jgi:hypothetical protein
MGTRAVHITNKAKSWNHTIDETVQNRYDVSWCQKTVGSSLPQFPCQHQRRSTYYMIHPVSKRASYLVSGSPGGLFVKSGAIPGFCCMKLGHCMLSREATGATWLLPLLAIFWVLPYISGTEELVPWVLGRRFCGRLTWFLASCSMCADGCLYWDTALSRVPFVLLPVGKAWVKRLLDSNPDKLLLCSWHPLGIRLCLLYDPLKQKQDKNVAQK